MRGRRGGDAAGAAGAAGAPFYAPPPRRKTSAEIISEARAAIYGDMATGASGGGSGALRALPTRRPFTPRDPQRTLFAERAKRDTRPPSAFSLKYLGASEGALAAAARGGSLGDDGPLLVEPQPSRGKQLHGKTRSLHADEPPSPAPGMAEAARGGLARLPHLSGRSKPLHRRKHHAPPKSKSEDTFASAMRVTRLTGPACGATSGATGDATGGAASDATSDEAATRRLHFAGAKSRSDEIQRNKKVEEQRSSSAKTAGAIGVRQLAVQATRSQRHDLASDSATTMPYGYSAAELAEALGGGALPAARVPAALDALHAALEAGGGCARASPAVREAALRALYAHVGGDDERALVGVARTMLAMRVTGGNLATACKLIFKVARNDKNDHLFKKSNILELLVEGCGRACPLAEGECCVYGAGALRFLALEPSLRALAVAAGALHLAALHLQIINRAKSENPRGVSEQTSHALYQLTGALRNLAGGDELSGFVASGALRELTDTLRLFITDRDIVTNVTRTMSVVSTDAECCAWLCANVAAARALVLALRACASRAPLAVRLAYTLGNMAAASETARLNIYSEPGAVDVLLTVLETQLASREGAQPPRRGSHQEDPDLSLVGSYLAGSDGSCEDVLVKTVRVLANLCLAERAGRGLAAEHAARALPALLACCAPAQHDQFDESMEDDPREELVTAALATLNNLTFYHDASSDDGEEPFDYYLEDMCRVACGYVSSGARGRGGRAACEAVRALGNVTRAPRAARLALAASALDALEPFHQHEEAAVRCGAAGVLVNVCGAAEAAAGGRGGEAAARALGAAARARDTPAAALLARALWNAHARRPLQATSAARAARALTELMDDESVFAACEGGAASAAASDVKQVKFGQPELNSHDRGDEEDSLPPPLEGFQDEDIGDEDGDKGEQSDLEDYCECPACVRLSAWEELMSVALPLLDKLRPPRADAAVGTD